MENKKLREEEEEMRRVRQERIKESAKWGAVIYDETFWTQEMREGFDGNLEYLKSHIEKNGMDLDRDLGILIALGMKFYNYGESNPFHEAVEILGYPFPQKIDIKTLITDREAPKDKLEKGYHPIKPVFIRDLKDFFNPPDNQYIFVYCHFHLPPVPLSKWNRRYLLLHPNIHKLDERDALMHATLRRKGVSTRVYIHETFIEELWFMPFKWYIIDKAGMDPRKHEGCVPRGLLKKIQEASGRQKWGLERLSKRKDSSGWAVDDLEDLEDPEVSHPEKIQRLCEERERERETK